MAKDRLLHQIRDSLQSHRVIQLHPVTRSCSHFRSHLQRTSSGRLTRAIVAIHHWIRNHHRATSITINLASQLHYDYSAKISVKYPLPAAAWTTPGQIVSEARVSGSICLYFSNGWLSWSELILWHYVLLSIAWYLSWSLCAPAWSLWLGAKFWTCVANAEAVTRPLRHLFECWHSHEFDTKCT